jgi:hypothetical protein
LLNAISSGATCRLAARATPQARAAALSGRKAARQGNDPAAARTPQAPPAGPDTVAQLIERYAKGDRRYNFLTEKRAAL